jgi:hypothetical protein
MKKDMNEIKKEVLRMTTQMTRNFIKGLLQTASPNLSTKP